MRDFRLLDTVRGLGLVLFALGCALSPGQASTAATTTALASAPDFELPAADGPPFRLSKHNGSVRVLFFVRNDGRFVAEALNATERVATSGPSFERKTVLVCIVAMNLDGSQFDAFRGQSHLWTFLHDRTESVHRLYQVIAVPTVVVVNERGCVCGRLAGYSFAFGKEFRSLLRACLGLPESVADSNITTTRQAAHFVALGELMVGRSMWAAALRNFQKALELAPEMRAARLGAGFCLLRIGQAKAATAEFQRVLAADANSTQALIGLAWAKALDGKPEPARTELEKLRPLASELSEYFEAWAAVHEATGGREEAQRDRQKADRLRPHSVLAPVSRPKKGTDGTR